MFWYSRCLALHANEYKAHVSFRQQHMLSGSNSRAVRWIEVFSELWLRGILKPRAAAPDDSDVEAKAAVEIMRESTRYAKVLDIRNLNVSPSLLRVIKAFAPSLVIISDGNLDIIR
jgi:hypothetical protein